jgi:hypothetical protein
MRKFLEAINDYPTTSVLLVIALIAIIEVIKRK